VRELLNVIERMMVLTDRPTLEPEDLPAFIRQRVMGKNVPGADIASHSDPYHTTQNSPAAAEQAPQAAETPIALEHALSHMTLAELEDRAIMAALVRFNNNRTRAARALGISVRTLQRKLGAKNGEQQNDSGDINETPESDESQRQPDPTPLVGTSL